MDAAGNILTDMYYAQAKTLPVTPEDVVFELSVEQNVEDWTLTISAVPNNDEVRYLMDVYNGTNTPEAIAESYQEMLDEIIYLLPILGGGTVYDYFMEMSYQGEATSTPIDIPMASEFTAFAVGSSEELGQHAAGRASSVSLDIVQLGGEQLVVSAQLPVLFCGQAFTGGS